MEYTYTSACVEEQKTLALMKMNPEQEDQTVMDRRHQMTSSSVTKSYERVEGEGSMATIEDSKMDIKLDVDDLKMEENEVIESGDGESAKAEEVKCEGGDSEDDDDDYYFAGADKREKGNRRVARGTSRWEKFMERLLLGAETSEMAVSQCRFQCPACDFSSGGWEIFKKHGRLQRHGLFRVKHIRKFLTRTVAHGCFECGSKVLADSSFLGSHTNSRHNMTVKAYTQKYGCSLQAVEDKQVAKLVQSGTPSLHLGNMCEFTCSECNVRFSSHRNMQDHLSKKEHHFAMNKVVDQRAQSTVDVESCITRVVTYECKLCHATTLCDMRYLKRHFEREHGMRVAEYAAQTGARLSILNRRGTGEMRAIQRQQAEAGGGAGGPEYSAQIDDLCWFACTKCDFRTNAWRALESHRDETSHARDGSTPDWMFLREVVWHKCLICRKSVLCDSLFLRNHVKDKHQLTLQQYKLGAAFRKAKSQT